MSKNAFLWIVACATALIVPIIGCAAGSFEVAADTPIGDGSLRFISGGQPVTFQLTGDRNTNGLCVGLTFKDASGAVVGSSSGKIPVAGTLPTGAAIACGEITLPEESAEPFLGVIATRHGSYPDAGDALIPFGPPMYSFFNQPLQPDLTQGVRATSLDIFVETLDMARSIASGISLGAPLGPEVRVNQYLHAILDGEGTTILLTVADDNPFHSMSLDVQGDNGSFTASLSQAFLHQFNGWHTATFAVPIEDLGLSYGIGAANSVFIGVRYEEALGVTEYDATWGFHFTAFP